MEERREGRENAMGLNAGDLNATSGLEHEGLERNGLERRILQSEGPEHRFHQRCNEVSELDSSTRWSSTHESSISSTRSGLRCGREKCLRREGLRRGGHQREVSST